MAQGHITTISSHFAIKYGHKNTSGTMFHLPEGSRLADKILDRRR